MPHSLAGVTESVARQENELTPQFRRNVTTIPGIFNYPLRELLSHEIHARASTPLKIPTRVSHLALLSGAKGADQDREHVAELCRRFNAPEPNTGANCWILETEKFRLNWERHGEFSTYTFYCEGAFTDPFAEPVIARVPEGWLAGAPGELLVALHVALESRDVPERQPDELVSLFASNNLAGNVMSGGAAIGWSDFRLHDDGFSRFLVRDINLTERKAGRLIQRLLEIETYRMMASVAFPLTWELAPEATRLDQTLAELTVCMTHVTGPEEEHALLEQLSQLAAEIERLTARTNARFSATRAYYALVQKRIEELREQRIEGRPTIKEFMERRLGPAVKTCEAVHERLESLSERVSRAANLLRTRVDVAMERQNRDLLRSMNRRARLQLRLQETVEGLSVIVLSYYLTGLVGYAAKAAKDAGLPIKADLVTGLAIPLVVGIVWLGMRKLHGALRKEKDSAHTTAAD